MAGLDGRPRNRGWGRWKVIVALIALDAFLVVATPASAQNGPYGATTTEVPPTEGQNPSCVIEQGSGRAGDGVRGDVEGAPSGETVDIHLGGSIVTQVSVEPTPGGGTTMARFSFSVPSIPPGRYDIVAVGTAFSVTCGFVGGGEGFDVLAGAQVADANIVRTPEAQVGGRAGGRLPFTGMDVLTLIGAALAALGLGLVLRRWSSSRRGPGRAQRLPW